MNAKEFIELSISDQAKYVSELSEMGKALLIKALSQTLTNLLKR